MKHKLFAMLSLMVLLGMLLGACGGQPTAPEEVEVVATEVETVEEDVEEDVSAASADLDGAYSTMLAEMQGYNTVKKEDLAVELLEEPPPFLIDVRTVDEVTEHGHIPGAVHIPLNELGQHTELLPSFDTPIVTYCAGGWRATIAMTELAAAGFEDVRALKAKFSEWVDAGYPVDPGLPPEPFVLDAANPDPAFMAAVDEMLTAREGWGGISAEDLNLALTENPDHILIDVRRAEELDSNGYIEGSIHIPLEEFIANKDLWPADKDAPITIYCGSGHRSTMAAAMMWTYGYTDVTSLSGGFSGWADAGYPVTGGAADLDGAYSAMLAGMQGYNTVKKEDLAVELLEEPPPFIIDVRTVDEVTEHGHIPGAVHIPLDELGKHTDLLPSFDTPIVTYCAGGWRATIAMTELAAAGFEDVRALKAKFSEWVDAGYPVDPGLPPEPFVLDAANPDPAFMAAVDEMLTAREGWGGISAEDLNLALTENPDHILIDVRRAEELESNGLIEGSIHIPLEEFIANKDLWPADMDAPITIYCGSGHRSTMAAAMMWTYGYTDVTSLSGGFGGWADAGYPVVEYAAVQ